MKVAVLKRVLEDPAGSDRSEILYVGHSERECLDLKLECERRAGLTLHWTVEIREVSSSEERDAMLGEATVMGETVRSLGTPAESIDSIAGSLKTWPGMRES